MVTAFVLINITDQRAHDTAEALLALDGVAEVHLVAGEYDVVAVLRVADNATLASIITTRIVHVPGVDRTRTLFALESMAEIDLAQAFGVS